MGVQQMTSEEKDAKIMDLFIQLVQYGRQKRKLEYTQVRKEIVRMYHEDKEARILISTALRSFRGINIEVK